jgi:copper oxidase (laccase) domain-containing protein
MNRLHYYFTDRRDGNMHFGLGSKEEVLLNRRTAADEHGFSMFTSIGKNLVAHGFSPKLVHGDGVIVIHREDSRHFDGSGILHPPTVKGDAVITDAINFPILLTGADCFLAILYDSGKNVLAVFHSGRSGTLLNIAGKTVAEMQAQFDCSVSDIVARLSPGICGKCYRLNSLDPLLLEKYPERVNNFSGELSLDLRGIILRQLLETGVQTKFIVNSDDECTCCTQQSGQPKYFSHYGWREKIPGHEIPGRNALLAEIARRPVNS